MEGTLPSARPSYHLNPVVADKLMGSAEREGGVLGYAGSLVEGPHGCSGGKGHRSLQQGTGGCEHYLFNAEDPEAVEGPLSAGL